MYMYIYIYYIPEKYAYDVNLIVINICSYKYLLKFVYMH